MSAQDMALRGNGRLAVGSRLNLLERQRMLLFYLGMLCVFSDALLQNIGQTFRLPFYQRPMLALGLVCIYFLLNNREILQKLRTKPYMNIFVFWAVFCALATYSSFVTKDTVPETNPVTWNIMLQTFVFEGLCLVVYALATDRTNELLRCLLLYVSVLVVLNDLLMFGGIRFYNGEFETYLIGSKFDVIYLHMNFIALFFVKLKLGRKTNRETRLPGALLLTMAAIIILIGRRVDCNTGMLGVLLQIALVYACDRWPRLVAKRLGSPVTFLIALLISVLFAYYVTWLLNLPAVKHLVEDTLHRTLTLTGRTEIYAAYPGVMQGHWGWGYGYGNAYPISWEYFGYADTQNALLEWILQIGLISTAAMVALFCVIMAFYRKKASLTSAAPLLVLLYVYIFLGTVEITINNNFWLFMIVLFLLACSDRKTEPETRIKLRFTPRQTRRSGRLRD